MHLQLLEALDWKLMHEKDPDVAQVQHIPPHNFVNKRCYRILEPMSMFERTKDLGFNVMTVT